MSATEVQTGVNTNLQKQDLSQLDVTKLTPLSPEVISRQATVNIGTIGHVAHGKSTVIKAISGVQTVRFKNELERNITIKLERIPYAKALELTRSCEKLRNFIKKQQKNSKKRENFSIHQCNKGIRDNSDDKYINSKNTNSTINKLMNKKNANNISYSKQKSMMDYFQISPKNKNLNEHVTLPSTIIENKSPSCSSDWSNSVILSSDHIITRELNYSDCDSVVSYKTKITNKLCSNEMFCDDILAPPLSPLSKNFKIPTISVKKNLKNKKEKIPKKKQEYIVESIQDLEELDSKPVFEVKWKNYPPTENTWEPLENLSDCNLLEPFIDNQVKKYRITIDKILNNILNEIESEDKLNFNEIEIIKKIDNEEYDNFYYSNIVDLILLALFYLAGAKRKVRERIIRNRVKDRLLVKPYLCRRIEQLEKIDEWKSKMNKEENNVEIEVENITDFDLPPENFNYIIKNMAHIDVHVPDDPPIGCNCVDGCSFKTNCCGKMSGSTFAYYTNRRLRIKPGFPIFECNKRCSCSADCLNRTVQNGRKNHLCIFKTNNGCGWGLKTQKVIHEGEFITEYIGEIITTKEADRRGKFYDSEGRTYLFDLDYNDGDCIYSIDAAYNGNVARFINHSCNPNSQIYPVWVDCLDPNLPRLALFALRRIEAGEEITFDYLNQHGKFNNGSLAFSSTATETVATETTIGNGENEKNLTDNNCSNTIDIDTKTNIDINLLAEIKPEKENMVCRCGSSKCRKYIF